MQSRISCKDVILKKEKKSCVKTTTDKEKIGRYKIISADLIDLESPLFHSSRRLAQKIAEII